jgi:tRNA-Thr(GGU) m(6)t(6)A37 methyltransferase TsaA
MIEFAYKAIGIIHSPFKEKKDTPIQGSFSDARGTVELFSEYAAGLKDIEGFSHLYLLYHFDRADEHCLIQKPFLDNKVGRGIFATRHYNRPNHIGLSIVGLLGVKGNVIEVGGIDVLDGTPLLDIKPLVRQFDFRENVRCGWVDEKDVERKKVKSFTPGHLNEE